MLSYGSNDATHYFNVLLTGADHTEIARGNALAEVLLLTFQLLYLYLVTLYLPRMLPSLHRQLPCYPLLT